LHVGIYFIKSTTR